MGWTKLEEIRLPVRFPDVPAERRRAPCQGPGKSDEDWAARLNDAGVIAFRRGDRQKAIAAFAQALETSDRWFARAANNLAYVESKK